MAASLTFLPESAVPFVTRFSRFFWMFALTLTCQIASVQAADAEAALTIRQNRFVPSELRVPAGVRVKLTIVNEDATAEEFESHALNREKVVPRNGRATVYIGPLKPGRYPFYGEYHESTAQGAVIAE